MGKLTVVGIGPGKYEGLTIEAAEALKAADIIVGYKKKEMRGIGIWAIIALILMFAGAIGSGAVPKEYFGIFERFSTFSAVGFNAVLGVYLFNCFKVGSSLE